MGIRGKQSKSLKTKATAPDESCRVFGTAGSQAFRELISKIEAGIRIEAEKPEKHFDEAVMEYGPQFKHGMRIRYITGAEYDAYFAREQEAYNREEQEAKEAHLDKLDAAAEWVRLAGNDRVINLINARIKAIGTRITFEPPLTLAFALKKVLTEDASLPADEIPVEIDAESRETLLNGLHQFKTWINVYYQSMSQTISQCDMPPTCSLESLQDLAAEAGCREIIDILDGAETRSERGMIHAEYFIIPRCLDLLGENPVIIGRQSDQLHSCPNSEEMPASQATEIAPSEYLILGQPDKPKTHWTLKADCTHIKDANGQRFEISQPGCQEALRFLISRKAIDVKSAVNNRELCEAVWLARKRPKEEWPKKGFKPDFFRQTINGSSSPKPMPFKKAILVNENGKWWLAYIRGL